MAPENDEKKPDKKSSKKARPLTSGQLRDVSAKKSAKAAKKEAVAKSPAQERLVTVQIWARGNANPLVQAFLSEHINQRTVKRTARAWLDLFRKWKERPRG